MKSKDKSNERHKLLFIFEYHFITLVTQQVKNLYKKKLKFRLLRFLDYSPACDAVCI